MSALGDFLKKNATANTQGALGVLGVGGDVAAIATGHSKLKDAATALKNLIFGIPMFQLAIVAAFTAMNKGIKAVLKDTGSLEAALKRLAAIRGLEKSLAPFVGGVDAAKTKVAELLVLAKSSNFKFEQFGSATQTLTVFTRGVYSSASALNEVADAAADTHNSLEATADVVGDFYSAIRNGQPIDSVTESMRQMGLITQQEAAYLDKLSASGAGASKMTQELNNALGAHRGGQARVLQGSNPDDVNVMSAKAISGAQQAIGAPFAEKDVANTKNYAEALQNITPMLESISTFLAKMTTAFTNVESSMVKWLTTIPGVSAAVGGLVKGLGLVVSVSAAVAGGFFLVWLGEFIGATAIATADAYALATSLFSVEAALTALGAAAVVVETLVGLGVVVAIIGAIVAGFSGLASLWGRLFMSDKVKEITKALNDMRRAFKESNDALKDQISSVTTLAERHEALQAALQHVKDAQEALNAARARRLPPEVKAPLIAEAQRELDEYEKKVNKLSSGGISGLGSEEQTAKFKAQAERELSLHEESYAARKEKAQTAGERLAISQEEIADILPKANDRGLRANLEIAEARAKADHQMAMAKESLSTAQSNQAAAQTEKEQLDKYGVLPGNKSRREQVAENDKNRAAAEIELAEATKQVNRAMEAPMGIATQDKYKGTSAYAFGKAQQIAAGMRGAPGGIKGTQADMDKWLVEAHKLEAIEARSAEYATKAQSLTAEQVEQRIEFEKTRQETLRGVKEQEALMGGNAREVYAQQNLAEYAQNLERAKASTSSPEEAQALAMKMTENFVRLNFPQEMANNASRVSATELARIGGGGRIGTGGDKMISLTQRIADLNQKATEYLKLIADAKGGKIK